MNLRNDRTLTPSHPLGEGLPYSHGMALFTSIVEIWVFLKLHVLQTKVTDKQTDKQTNGVASSLLELLVAAKNTIIEQ